MVCLLSTGFPYFYINNSRVSNNTRQTLLQGRAITLSCQYDQISSPNTKFFEVTPAGPTLISSSYSGQSRLFVTHTVPISEATGQHTYRCKSTNNVFVQVTIIFYGKWVKMKFLLGMTYVTAQCHPHFVPLSLYESRLFFIILEWYTHQISFCPVSLNPSPLAIIFITIKCFGMIIM